MSQSKLIAGATPSKRLSMQEFITERKKKIDDNHTSLIIKEISLKKDLEHTKEQITLHEGAVLFLNQIIKEWTVYENDTIRLRQAEQSARELRIKEQENLREKSRRAKRILLKGMKKVRNKSKQRRRKTNA